MSFIARQGLALLLTAVVVAVGLSGCEDGNKGSFTYGGQTYKTVDIGGRTWMKENLNVTTAESWCYENSSDSCAKYGKLYTWKAAKSACPAGWHLPSRDEWKDLVSAAGGERAGKALKSTSSWKDSDNGTDSYGFSALSGGNRLPDSYFYNVGNLGLWWTATEGGSGAYTRYIRYSYDYMEEKDYDKSYGFSVRCIADN